MSSSPELTSSRFTIDVSRGVIDDLRARLVATRMPDPAVRPGWNDGVAGDVLAELTHLWANEFDWSVAQRTLNKLPHRRVRIDDVDLHYIHLARATEDLPVLLLHGWPSTFLQMVPLAERLIAPPAGRPGLQAVVVSLPGFAFSGRPRQTGWNLARMAEAMHQLMVKVLGLERYAVRGSDWGLSIALILGARYPENVVGVHVGGAHLRVVEVPEDASEEEQEFIAKSDRWYREEGAYNDLQATKPQTIGVALNDSPAGLLAWIVEKHHTWSVPGALFDVFSREEILTIATIYWATQTITSSARLYREEYLKPSPIERVRVPLAIRQPDLEEYRTPASWWRRSQPTASYAVMPNTAHFPEREDPNELAHDIATFLTN